MVLFNLYESDITGLVGTVCLFADDTEACNCVEYPGDVCNMEHDLEFLENRSKQWKPQFKVSKCKIIYLGKNNPLIEYNIGGESVGHHYREKRFESSYFRQWRSVGG